MGEHISCLFFFLDVEIRCHPYMHTHIQQITHTCTYSYLKHVAVWCFCVCMYSCAFAYIHMLLQESKIETRILKSACIRTYIHTYIHTYTAPGNDDSEVYTNPQTPPPKGSRRGVLTCHVCLYVCASTLYVCASAKARVEVCSLVMSVCMYVLAQRLA